jgi:biopolymer transport protein ExbB
MQRTAGRGYRRRINFYITCLLALFVLCFVVSEFQPAEAQAAGGAPDGGGVGDVVKHYLKSVGWVMGIVLGTVSVAMVFLIVLLFIDLRLGAAIPPGFVEEFTDTVNKRRFKEAYELAKNDGSFLARVLSTGMSRLQYGIEDAREAALNMVETIRTGKESLVSYLAVVGTLGPLLGLVGTVVGMIGAFRALGGAQTGKPPEFSVLAEQLSHALVVTFFGILLSVPAIVAHQFFKNRLAAVTQDTSNIGDDLLTQMYHNSKRAAAPGQPSGSSPDTRQPAPAPATQTGGVVAAR